MASSISPEQIMSTSQQSSNGHRKGTTSSFFLNVDYVLNQEKKTEKQQNQGKACEIMLRKQMIDIVKSNGVGELFDWRDERLEKICQEEIEKRGGEEVEGFDEENKRALEKGEVCGFTGEDFLPGNQDFGKTQQEMGEESSSSSSSSRDLELLKQHLERQKGVRKGTFGAFCANYRVARGEKDPQKSEGAKKMRELLPDVKKLGFLEWWVCRDEWAEKLVRGEE